MKEQYFIVYSGIVGGLTMDERIERYERLHSELGVFDLDDILQHDFHKSNTVVTMVVG